MASIDLITTERNEQIEKHGRTLKYDKMNNSTGQLAMAAVALIENDGDKFSQTWDKAICEKMINKSYQERLVIAGALIAAELDRIS